MARSLLNLILLQCIIPMFTTGQFLSKEGFESRMARMSEFHECGFIISNKIRVLRPFLTFVFQSYPVENPNELLKIGKCFSNAII